MKIFFFFYVFICWNGASVFWAGVTVCNPTCRFNMDEVIWFCCVYMCSLLEWIWLEPGSVSAMVAADVCLCLFLMGKMILNYAHTHKTSLTHIHTSNPNSLQSHSGTDDVIHLWCCRVTKALLCLCKHMHSYSHIHTFLPVCGSREQTELNAHVASLCRGKRGIYHSFTISFVKAGEQ